MSLYTASLFATKIWWTKGQLIGGIWHWDDAGSTWFLFDPTTTDTPSATAVSLQTDIWMNAKSDKSESFHKICEMSKQAQYFQKVTYNYKMHSLTPTRMKMLLDHNLNGICDDKL